MKPSLLFFLLSLFFIFQSCTSVTFEEPQPSDEPDLESIPAELTGKYLNLSDSSVFTVNTKLAIRTYLITVCEPLSKIDSLYELTADTFLILTDSLRMKTHIINNADTIQIFPDPLRVKAQIINDTVCARFNYVDTIFNLSEKNVLRKYKQNYFMNVLEEKGWEVIKLELHKNKLYVATISSKEDVRKLRKITETTDTTKTVFKPTPAQFKKFVRKRGFDNEEVLKRVE